MKKDLLLLHGALGSQKQLALIAENHSNQYNIHTINFSGHGGSPIQADFGIPLFVSDVLRYLKKHNLKKVTIFGYSMGGYVALKLAANHPGKISKISTLGTKFDWSAAATDKELKMLNPDLIEKKVPKFATALQKEHQDEDWKKIVRQTAKMMRQLSDQDQLTTEEFNNIDIPVKVGLGDTDEMVSKTETLETIKQLPNATFVELKDSPHQLTKVPMEEIRRLLV